MIHSKPITVVLDIGSYRTFAGPAGEENPRLAAHSYLTTDTNFKADDIFMKYSVGDNDFKLERTTDKIESIFNPTNEFGQVEDYQLNKDRFESFIEILLTKNLGFENISILLAEDVVVAPHQSKQRQDICEFLFEALEVDSLTFIKKPVLSCFSVGRASGMVLDSGHSFTRASVVQDGFCVYNKYVNYGGATLHGEISQLLDHKSKGWQIQAELSPGTYDPSAISFHRMIELQKIKNLFATSEGMDQDQMVPQDNDVEHTLPDGNCVNLSRSEIVDPFTQFPNFFLKYLDLNERSSSKMRNSNVFPSFITDSSWKNYISYRSPAQLVVDSLNQHIHRLQRIFNSAAFSGQQKTTHNNQKLIRNDMLSNIILTGGNFLFADLVPNTRDKLLSLTGEQSKTIISPIYNRNNNDNSTSWVGGSIVADLPTFNSFWIHKKDWNEGKTTSVMELDPKKNRQGVPKNFEAMGLLNKKCP